MEESPSSLPETPTWSVATVLTVMVALGFAIHKSIRRLREWLVHTRRKALLAAMETIVGEMMVFGLLSLLLGHWTVLVSKICVKETALATRFYPCVEEAYDEALSLNNYTRSMNASGSRKLKRHSSCPEGLKSFVDYENLEQLHRFLLVLGVIHVLYCFFTVSVAMLKIYSWRIWEGQAESLVTDNLEVSRSDGMKCMIIKRQSTFIFHHTSHPWSKHKVLIWMVCFARQFWSSIDRADYMALRLGFITNHKLHISYNFHSYMLRSMEDEFREIVGISVPLWGYAILCTLLNIHGTNAYFWLSLVPAVLILAVGTKLQHIVIKLALEVSDENSCKEDQLTSQDGLFWFGKPELLLWLIQLILFHNAFEMATMIWSLWEIKGTSCFMKNTVFLVIRLISGIIIQFWCSYCTFPLYIIITQMGSKLKKSLFAESVRDSLQHWRKRGKQKSIRDSCAASLTTVSSHASLDLVGDEIVAMDDIPLDDTCMNSIKAENIPSLCEAVQEQDENHEELQGFELFQIIDNLGAPDTDTDEDADEDDGSENEER